jgi:DNA-binding MurR/RpiR family transcriptional regulator
MNDEQTAKTDILDVIAVRASSLSPAERAIADVILADPDAANDLTSSHMARLARSSEATVTRFCRSIGLSGYAQLRLRLALALERRRSGEQADSGLAMLAELEPDDPLADIVKKVAFANVQAVELTASQLDLAMLTAVVDAISAAERIVTFGVGSSTTAAVDAAHKLVLSGKAAVSSSDIHHALMITAQYGSGDALIVFSHSGRTREALELISHADQRGVTTIVVTSDTSSPAAKAARLKLGTAAREISFRSGGVASRMAQLTVIDTLFVLMSHRRFDQSLDAAAAMHEAVGSHIVVTDRAGR